MKKELTKCQYITLSPFADFTVFPPTMFSELNITKTEPQTKSAARVFYGALLIKHKESTLTKQALSPACSDKTIKPPYDISHTEVFIFRSLYLINFQFKVKQNKLGYKSKRNQYTYNRNVIKSKKELSK